MAPPKPAGPSAVARPAAAEQAQQGPEVQQGTVSVDDLFAQIGRGVMEKEVMQRNVNQRNGMIFQLQKELKAKTEAFDALQKSYDALIAGLKAEANSVPGEGQNEAPSVEEAKTETQAALDAIPFKRNENT